MDNTLRKIDRLIKNLLIIFILQFFIGCVPDVAIDIPQFPITIPEFPIDIPEFPIDIPEFPIEKPEAAIYAWFTDGTVKQISPSGGRFYQSCIHPEGMQVICSGNFEGAPRIWKMDLSTKDRVALSPEDAASIHGVFSWDGEQIVFASDMGLNRQTPSFDVDDITTTGSPPVNAILNIFIMDADGSNIRQLTYGPYQDLRPTFSPDGKYVVFVNGYYSGGNRLAATSPLSTLWIVPTDGSQQPKAIPMYKPAYRPWFSADGKRLYFFTTSSNSVLPRHQICSMPVGGGYIKPIASDNKGQSHGPFVDPGGDKLLMHSTRDGKWKIYEISLSDGSLVSLQPQGFEDISVAHATRAINGVMTFDAGEEVVE